MKKIWVYLGAVIMSVIFWGCGETPPQQSGYSSDSYLDINEVGSQPSGDLKGGTVYTIKKGDTLSQISQRVYGTAKLWPKIVEANPGIDPRALRIGQKIVIPALK